MKEINQKIDSELSRLQVELDRWREVHSGKRIPQELWEEAIRLARREGLSKVSKRLGLFYPTLRRRVQEPAFSQVKAKKEKSPSLSFVEVPLENPPLRKTSEALESRFLFQFHWRLGTLKLEWM